MKQLGSMATRPASRIAMEEQPLGSALAPLAVTASLGLPVLLCVFASLADAAPQQIAARPAPGFGSSTSGIQDHDGDGLDDALELGQYSLSDHFDTDGDGWSDGEELARRSLATAACSQPVERQGSIGARPYMRAGKLHVAVGTYVHSGSLSEVSVNIGIAASRHLLPLSPSVYTSSAILTTLPTRNPGELVVIMDVIIPDGPLIRTGSMSVFATLRIGDLFHDAAVINLVMQDNIPVELIGPEQMSPVALQVLGPGILHRPLGGTTAPPQWSSGEICFQSLESVGTHGAMVTQEVTSSSCVGGWDGYCDGGSCSSSVGSTVDLVDPSGLIGG